MSNEPEITVEKYVTTAEGKMRVEGPDQSSLAPATGSATSCSIEEILECLSECEWALTEAVNHDKIGWLQETARDNAREMLKKCAESPNEKLSPLDPNDPNLKQ